MSSKLKCACEHANCGMPYARRDSRTRHYKTKHAQDCGDHCAYCVSKRAYGQRIGHTDLSSEDDQNESTISSDYSTSSEDDRTMTVISSNTQNYNNNNNNIRRSSHNKDNKKDELMQVLYSYIKTHTTLPMPPAQRTTTPMVHYPDEEEEEDLETLYKIGQALDRAQLKKRFQELKAYIDNDDMHLFTKWITQTSPKQA
ncbi:hypothetical protein SAMD00019534_058940 [Acytostelium subglobosum LB1]|uniref:hypothetical protein n=1 Tax=Acytostelium subglobosum LB1 TaxID=1410327 RepID=UPI000644BB8F|nr:hypothetical protein SAMD00019534_058940 [Acytostelium subglobosum LB1]GAM22719.1 hypothetical protein SAMD00019534_058940 [Acytostelium subglobosum LB1]|eukprot:XP_012753946.1 hypothetical protein SAMD00019534_058940 [Acytostelium subglobosum LB1]